MKLLLDSHALLWWLTDHPALSMPARAAIADPENEVMASAVSVYELAYKAVLGKLPQIIPTELSAMMRGAGIPAIPLGMEAALRAARLPGPHRDPWDRLLMGQALSEQQTVVTRDAVFAAYRVQTLW